VTRQPVHPGHIHLVVLAVLEGQNQVINPGDENCSKRTVPGQPIILVVVVEQNKVVHTRYDQTVVLVVEEG
jgi:hypothetical protein